jgi:hypothetical protein
MYLTRRPLKLFTVGVEDEPMRDNFVETGEGQILKAS